jgi:hypothetical protein
MACFLTKEHFYWIRNTAHVSVTTSTEKSPSWEANGHSAGQEISPFYGTRSFISVFTIACHWSIAWASWIHSYHHILFPPFLLRLTDTWVRLSRTPHTTHLAGTHIKCGKVWPLSSDLLIFNTPYSKGMRSCRAMKWKSMRWARHVARAGGTRNAHKY